MIEIILLLLLLGGFIYATIYLRNDEKDEEGNKKSDFDIVFIVSMVILATSFVLGILFSDRVIKFFMSVSKLASIGIFLHKIKSYFVGSSEPKTENTEEKVINMKGGGMESESRHNDMYDDDELPESDDEQDY